jgi:hypothetical protein
MVIKIEFHAHARPKNIKLMGLGYSIDFKKITNLCEYDTGTTNYETNRTIKIHVLTSRKTIFFTVRNFKFC